MSSDKVKKKQTSCKIFFFSILFTSSFVIFIKKMAAGNFLTTSTT
ncbi:MAG: sortase B protein-sorting domain-containing protein [Lentisphaerae bacterium]|nr:sortase B protein-sorting domain-containing protein [Lentisphaerota bacterium]